jgi:ribosome modulation factor
MNSLEQPATPNRRSPASGGSASDRDRLKAKMDGACAALEGRKMSANQYPEESDLHFEWLAGWTSAKMEMRKTPNKV